MPQAVVSLIIPAGQSLSSSLDLKTTSLGGIFLPVLWTPAALTLLISPDDVTYYDRFSYGPEGQGTEFILRNVVPGSYFMFALTPVVPFLKFRSGTRQVPVPQTADRTLQVVTYI